MKDDIHRYLSKYLCNPEAIHKSWYSIGHTFVHIRFCDSHSHHYQRYKHCFCFLSCCIGIFCKMGNHSADLCIYHRGCLQRNQCIHSDRWPYCKCYSHSLRNHIDKLKNKITIEKTFMLWEKKLEIFCFI